VAESFTKEFSLAMVDTEHEENGETWSKEEKDVLAELYIAPIQLRHTLLTKVQS